MEHAIEGSTYLSQPLSYTSLPQQQEPPSSSQSKRAESQNEVLVIDKSL